MTTHRTPRPARERGSSLILAIFMGVVISGTILGGMTSMRALDRATSVEFSADAQARSIAEAGLVDAYAWFRRQAKQPVAVFAPALDLAATPPVNETDDPARGLIRELELAPGLWGRYTVSPGVPPEPFDDTNGNGYWDRSEGYVDVDGNGRWTPGQLTRDVTMERGLAGTGTVWRIEARGEVFRRVDPQTALGEGRNHRLGMARLATEIRRLTIVPPASAAICAREGNLVVIGARGRIRAGTESGSVGVASGEGTVVTRDGGEIIASLRSTVVPEYRDSVHDVFGVEWAELKAMSDISSADGSQLPSPLPQYGIVTVEGDVTFGPARPLRGTAALVVRGNVVLGSGSNSFFNGVLYVDGNVVIRAPAYVRGTVIATGKVLVEGSGDYAEVEYDSGIVSRLLQAAGQYRFSKALYGPAHILEDGRPSSVLAPAAVEALRGEAVAGDDDDGGTVAD